MTASTTTPPGWYRDPRTPGQLRYFDGVAWTDHVSPEAPAAVAVQPWAAFPPTASSTAPGIGASPSDPVHWILPTGRSWQSVAAGYVALFSIVLLPLGIVAAGLGGWALWISSRTGTHGRGRAIFAIVVGLVTTLLLGAAVVSVTG
jgi:hypothetical protein